MVDLHWWSPARSLRSAASEFRHAFGAWGALSLQGKRSLVNFGDEVSPLVLEEMTGRQYRWSPLRDAEVIGVGSLLENYVEAGAHGLILGSGARSDPSLSIPEESVLAVRGPRTALSVGIPSIAKGDPGLAVAAVMGKSPRSTRGTVVVPHFRVFGSRRGRAELARMRRAGFHVVPPTLPPLEVARRLASAEQVLSSSLHGLIFAHSLGRPAQLLAFDGVAEEPAFKYRDHMDLFGLATSFEASSQFSTPARMPPKVARAMESAQSTVANRLPSVLDGLYSAASALQ